MRGARFGAEDIEYLRGQTSRTGARVFEDDFLAYLHANGTFDGISMHAIPEGRVVHPNVPLTVVEGPPWRVALLGCTAHLDAPEQEGILPAP